jgi:hypothetical protein
VERTAAGCGTCRTGVSLSRCHSQIGEFAIAIRDALIAPACLMATDRVIASRPERDREGRVNQFIGEKRDPASGGQC